MKKIINAIKMALEKILKIATPLIALYRIVKEVIDRWEKS